MPLCAPHDVASLGSSIVGPFETDGRRKGREEAMFVSRADVCSVPQCGQRPSSSRSDDPIDWWPAHVTCATSMGESSSRLLARTQQLPSNEMGLAGQCAHHTATTLYSHFDLTAPVPWSERAQQSQGR